MAAERVVLASPLASAGGRVIVSPFQFYVSGEDNLRVRSVNSLFGARVSLQGRFLEAGGRLIAFSEVHVPNNDRSGAQSDYPLGNGYLLNLSVVVSNGAPLLGQTFVMVQLIRGLSGATIVLGCLLQGYITSTQQLAWPGSPIVSSTEAEPWVRQINGTNPAAGVEIDERVPAGARWELLNCYVEFVTDGNAADRRVRLAIAPDAAADTAIVSTNVIQIANQDFGYTFSPNLPFANDTLGNIQCPMSERMILQAAARIRTSTAGLQVGDNWDAPRLQVREWLEVP
mgnify:CR=1 FL=1